MDLLKERDQFLAQLKRADFWRQDQRFDRQTEDALDAADQKPARFDMYFAGLLNGFIFGGFLAWLIFGRGAS